MKKAEAKDTKTIEIPVKTIEFLRYLAKQNVTLPAAMVHHLKWDRYTIREIKDHLNALFHALDGHEDR